MQNICTCGLTWGANASLPILGDAAGAGGAIVILGLSGPKTPDE